MLVLPALATAAALASVTSGPVQPARPAPLPAARVVTVDPKTPDLLQVLSGDLLQIGETRIRLADVAAPAPEQRCATPTGFYGCGAAARESLRGMVAGKGLQCRIVGREKQTWATDPVTELGVCSVGPVDVAWQQVQLGFAVPRAGGLYESDGLAACARHTGIWAYTVESPWTYRARREGMDIRPIFLGLDNQTPCLRAMQPGLIRN